jgi:Baseplate J-like protein
MTAPINATPLSIDYTSRDYYALRNDLVTRMQTRLSDWIGNDPADFGLALVESFAYMGDLINYYIDRAANESFIGTATQRQSVINIANTYGYYPAGYRAAYVTITLTNSSSTELVIPKGTQFMANVIYKDTIQQVMFTTTVEATVLANSSTEITAIQAEDISTKAENYSIDLSGETLGVSSETPDQQFTLKYNHVVEGSVQVWVKNGDVFEKWSEVTHITDAGPKDAVYYLTMDSNNYVCVNFGDGVSGVIPPNNSTIRAIYNYGGGVIGNIPSGTSLDIFKLFGLDSTTETNIRRYITAITSEDAVGGEDPEETNSIRRNAPLLLTTMNRAVTLKDFANLSLGVTEVGKANAYATVPSSVTVYIAPQQNSTTVDAYPGYIGDTFDPLTSVTSTSFNNMKQSVIDYLSDKIQIGTSVTVAPPVYTPVFLSLAYTIKNGYESSKVESNIRLAVFDYYSYSNLDFAQVITPEEIEARLRRTDGVETIKVKFVNRQADATPSRSVLVGAVNEIFTFEDVNVAVSLLSSNSKLSASSGLVVKNGSTPLTLSPVFNNSFYAYNATNSGTAVTVTPTVDGAATISVSAINNGSSVLAPTAVATGVASPSITTATGLTVITVTVTAADSVNSTTYVVNVTK